MESTEVRAKIDAAFDRAARILKVSIQTVGAVGAKINSFNARDPKIVALALLCRTISHFKGVIAVMKEDLVIEAQVLARCSFENLIWVCALQERGAEFVEAMLRDDAVNQKTVGELTLKLASRAGANNNDEDGALLRSLIREADLRFPEKKKLRVDKTAMGSAVELSYSVYGQLSLQAAHPTITAIGRHLATQADGKTTNLIVEVMPETSVTDVMRTLHWACSALLGVAVGTNQMVTGSAADEALSKAFDELGAWTIELESTKKEH